MTVQHGADPMSKDRFGYVALDDARRAKHDLCVRLLNRAMSRRSWTGKARVLLRRILMRDSLRFKPAWGEMITMSKFAGIAFDKDHGGGGQIIEYDPAYLSTAGWLTDLIGTVFRIPILHIQSMVLLSIMYGYYSIARKATPDMPHPPFPVMNGSTFGVSLVGGMLGFLLALFNANGLDRWWQTRLLVGQMISRLINLCLLVGTHVKPPKHNPMAEWDASVLMQQESMAATYRKTLVRWINLFHILVYTQARNVHDISDLVMDKRFNPPRQWLTEEEWGILQGRAHEPAELTRESINRRLSFARLEQALRGNNPSEPPLSFASQQTGNVKKPLIGR